MADRPAPSPIQQAIQQGQRAFESGQYRAAVTAFEQAVGAAEPGTVLHGEATVWLVTAYQAADDRELARELCKSATRHPQWATRQASKRLLYILEAPELRKRDDWSTKIPDLEALDSDKDDPKWVRANLQNAAPQRPRPNRPPEGYQIPAPTDPSQVETEDRAFVWVVLGAIALVVVGLAIAGLPG
jgi:thioredoxin-like negative regulator of GroEL